MFNQPGTDIIKRLKKSDKAAFNAVFNQYYDAVFNNIYFKTKDYDVAKDLAQETFLKCWDCRTTIDDSKSFYYWLITIASNLTTNYFKREQMRSRHHDNIQKTSETLSGSANEQIEVNELQSQIDNIVTKNLPKKCQTIFIMSRIEGKSNAEIAEELSISKKTVENQLYEGLKIIRKKLQKTMGGYSFSFVLL